MKELVEFLESYQVMCKLSEKSHSFLNTTWKYSITFYRKIEKTDLVSKIVHVSFTEGIDNYIDDYCAEVTLYRISLFDTIDEFIGKIEECPNKVNCYKIKKLTIDEVKQLVKNLDKRC